MRFFFVMLMGVSMLMLAVCSSKKIDLDPVYRSQVNTGNLDSAQIVLESIVSENSKDADAQFYLGKIKFAHSDWMGAISHLKKATKLDSAGWEAGYFLMLAYDKLGKYDTSLEVYRTMVMGKYPCQEPIDTGYVAAVIGKTQLLFSRNAKDLNTLAIMSLKKYTERSPGHPLLFPLRAEAAYKMVGEDVQVHKMQRRAYEILRKKVRKVSKKQYLLLDARFAAHRKARMKACDKGLEIYPQEVSFLLAKAGDRLEYIDNDGALNAYKKALEIFPYSLDAQIGSAVTSLNKGYAERAVKKIDKVILQDPASAIAFYNRGVAYEQTRQGKLAIQEYRKAILLDGQYIDALYNLGRMYYLFNKFDDSQKTLERVLILAPKHADAAVIISNILIKSSKLEEAWGVLKSVLKYDPDNEVIQQNLIKIPLHYRDD